MENQKEQIDNKYLLAPENTNYDINIANNEQSLEIEPLPETKMGKFKKWICSNSAKQWCNFALAALAFTTFIAGLYLKNKIYADSVVFAVENDCLKNSEYNISNISFVECIRNLSAFDNDNNIDIMAQVFIDILAFVGFVGIFGYILERCDSTERFENEVTDQDDIQQRSPNKMER